MKIGTEAAAPRRQEKQLPDAHVKHPAWEGEPCNHWARGQSAPQCPVLPVGTIPICAGYLGSTPDSHGYYQAWKDIARLQPSGSGSVLSLGR